MSFRFLHASDLHLGKPFGRFPEEIRHRLREARHAVISRLALAARDAGAATVLLAGDTFDAETPSPQTLAHALRAMAAEGDIRWILLPGNHDSLAASELWRRIAADGARNIQAILDDTPQEIAAGVFLLPAPCTRRRPGRDLTESMSQPTPEGALRIGFGHGAISDFTGEEGVPGIIPPDRARLSGLDYLALGDWHGQMRVAPETWYSGTPERDGFKHAGAGGALAVTLAGGGAEVAPVTTGRFDWQNLDLDLLPGEPAVTRAEALFPPPAARRDMLLRLSPKGRLGLEDHAALARAMADAAPDFGWFEADLSALSVDVRPEDLDSIDRGGALRRAAEILLEESRDPTLGADAREIATVALARLHALAGAL